MAGKISEDPVDNTAADAAVVPIVVSGENKAVNLGTLRPGFHTSSNSSGDTTVTLGAQQRAFTEVTDVSGSGGTTRKFVLDVAAPPATGAVLRHRVNLPATSGITVEWRDATSGGTLLMSYVSDGVVSSVLAELYFDGTAWKKFLFTAPATA